MWRKALILVFVALSAFAGTRRRIVAPPPPSEFLAPDTDGIYSLSVGTDGATWFTPVSFWRFYVGRISAQGRMATFTVSQRATIVRSARDGSAWVKLGSTTLAQVTSEGSMSEYFPPVAEITDMAVLSDGSLCITDRPGNRLALVDANGNFSILPMPTDIKEPQNVAAADNASFWFTAAQGHICVANRERSIECIQIQDFKDVTATDIGVDSTGVWVTIPAGLCTLSDCPPPRHGVLLRVGPSSTATKVLDLGSNSPFAVTIASKGICVMSTVRQFSSREYATGVRLSCICGDTISDRQFSVQATEQFLGGPLIAGASSDVWFAVPYSPTIHRENACVSR